MAKLIFYSGTISNTTTFRGAGATDTDINYIINEPISAGTSQTFDITQAQYDGLFDGSKTLELINGVPTVVDTPVDTTIQTNSADMFSSTLNDYKKHLNNLIENKPNHSKISQANACKDFLETVDVSTLTFPGDCLEKILKDNNKYIQLSVF